MTTTLIITFGIMLGGWSFLRVLGGERQRQIQRLEAERAAMPPAADPAPPQSPSSAAKTAAKSAVGKQSVR